MVWFRHGVIHYRAVRVFSDFIEPNKLGWLAINNTFVKTLADPPTVHGADLWFVKHTRLPAGQAPDDLSLPPDLVVVVRSPSEHRGKIFTIIGEYLRAGAAVVVILDPDTATASVYRPDVFQQIFDNGDELVIPDVLPGFAVPVRKFFE